MIKFTIVRQMGTRTDGGVGRSGYVCTYVRLLGVGISAQRKDLNSMILFALKKL